MDFSIIREEMNRRKSATAAEMNDVYKRVADSVKDKPLKRINSEIAVSEASLVNLYVQNLIQSLRKTMREKLIEAGAPENMVDIVWIEASQAVGVPEVALCRANDPSAGESEPKVNEPKVNKPKANERRKTDMSCLGPTIILAGVAVEVVGWLFIPSYRTWAAIITRGIGVLLVVTGICKTCVDAGGKEARIKVSKEFEVHDEASPAHMIEEICEVQNRLNTEIILGWLDRLSEALIKSCGGRLGGV